MRASYYLILALLSGCSFDHLKDQGTKVGTAAILDRPVTYAEVYQAVLLPRCVGCHSAQASNGVNLETFESTEPLASQIEKAALKDKTMPKGGSLSDEEAQILSTWIAQGATRNGGSPPNPRLRERITWAVVRDEIFEYKCLDCHSPPRAEKDLDLTSLDLVRSKINLIFDRSVVTREADQVMPRPPFEHLTVEEKQALAQWIALGMPE